MVNPQIVTLLFTDLASSTETLTRLGDEAADRLRRTHFSLLRGAVSHWNGNEVKTMGDGIMVAFASATDALNCAIEMQQSVDRHNRRNPEEALGLRVGLHVGEPIQDESDYFGTAVVAASRLCGVAQAGQILISETARGVIGGRGAYTYQPLARLELKGIPDPFPASNVVWEPNPDGADYIAEAGAATRPQSTVAMPAVAVAGTRRGSFLTSTVFIGSVAAVAIIAAIALGLVLATSGGGSDDGSSASGESAAQSEQAAPPRILSVQGYSEQEVAAHFVSLLFAQNVTPRTVHKWTQPLRIWVYGAASASDRSMIDQVIGELRTLIDVNITHAEAEGRENVGIYFVPASEFATYVRFLEPGQRFAYDIRPVGGGDLDRLGRAVMVIDSSSSPTPLDQRQRGTGLRCLFAGALGLVGRPESYPDGGIFGKESARTPMYTALDRRMIQLLYSNQVKVGTDEATMKKQLAELSQAP